MNDLGLLWTSLGGEIGSQFDDTVTLVNNTEKIETVTVPTGVRWLLIGGTMINNDSVNRTIQLKISDASDNDLLWIFSATGNVAAEHAYPQNKEVNKNIIPIMPIVLKAGWKMKFIWQAGGASAGGTGTYSIVYLEVPA